MGLLKLLELCAFSVLAIVQGFDQVLTVDACKPHLESQGALWLELCPAAALLLSACIRDRWQSVGLGMFTRCILVQHVHLC